MGDLPIFISLELPTNLYTVSVNGFYYRMMLLLFVVEIYFMFNILCAMKPFCQTFLNPEF